jgi:hypothetical protein
MSFFAPDPVVSGQAYRVVSVNGSVPLSLEQFTGDIGFAIEHDGAGPSQVNGQGSARADGVRVHEKVGENAGRDVRIWDVVADNGDFSATAIAVF